MTALAGIPAIVVTGARGSGKTTLISRLLGERPAGETWAVLLNERGTARIAPVQGVAVAEVDGGCMCCSAQVSLRVALTRLLRESRPARLFVELNAASHVTDVLRTIRNPWLAPVLALGPVVAVVEAAQLGAADGAAVDVAGVDVLCVQGDTAAVAPLAGGRATIPAAHATLAALQRTNVSDSR